MSEQKLTMSSLYRPGWHAFPKRHQMPLLQLTGPWLLEAGFGVDCRVRVQVVDRGRLVVTVVGEGQEDGVDTAELS